MTEQESGGTPKLDIGAPSTPPQDKGSSPWPWILALLVILLAGGALYYFWGDLNPAQDTGATKAKSEQAQDAGAAATGQAGGTIKLDGSQKSEQDLRKKPYGLDKSVDAVARSDESIQVGNKKVPVEELEKKLVVEQRGEMREKSLQDKKVSAWGVYLVRPGDSLWRIHYRLLREYLRNRKVKLAPFADQPSSQGYSSGVGKVLKFAEHMVGVYNLRTGHMSKNLNLLEPGQKVVVFNLSEIFGQLDKVNPNEINGIMYDGRVLFFPKPEKVEVSTKELAPPGKTPPPATRLPKE
ncbi:MAG: hypothetical protein K9K66_06580 [Desulfarculaceae bacterium]|nr:hypothetical protein [Desulfarculaceae bacterium]MCF8071754.1 hypothetical protein [Desulfarculaceae bacterium]MCF8101304.1 hypothetical protein [Desulfarculaceae bacterium]MCF8117263.1 hypothetical protein [Desulfarculaceae bacterium]